MNQDFQDLIKNIKACRRCVDDPMGVPLPHEPRPVFQVSQTAKILICGQAPGVRVHASGRPFTDPSGDRLRAWMAVTETQFYDTNCVAIVPMGFCFPGLNEKGADLAPRKECAPQWRAELLSHLSEVKLIMVVGSYAVKWHLEKGKRLSLTETVKHWRDYLKAGTNPIYAPLPHPSWRNNQWLKKNPWFEDAYLPELRKIIKGVL